MATQIFDSKNTVLLEPQAHQENSPRHSNHLFDGGAFRGFFYVMLFNLFLALIGAGLWELWRLVR